MRFSIPGSDINIRLFEKVQGPSDSYHIFECGVDHGDDAIDTICVGGSFHTATRLANEANERRDERKKQEAAKASVTPEPQAA